MRINQPRSFIFIWFILADGSLAFSVDAQSGRYVKVALHSQRSESLSREAIHGTGRDETHIQLSAAVESISLTVNLTPVTSSVDGPSLDHILNIS